MSMQESWQRFLAESDTGGLESAASKHRDDAGLRAATDGVFLCDLSGYALCSAVGPDAESFLQGQLSNDVQALKPGRAQLAAYNTPKGRMLASLLLWRIPEGFLLQVPGSIAAGLIKRLSMFVLRAKVKLADAGAQYVRIGIGGPRAARLLADRGMPAPDHDYDLLPAATDATAGTRQILRLPGRRYELLYANLDAARHDWSILAAGATVSSAAPWRWLGVRSGIADIEADTQDKYVPQMLNLELIGGVSFTKGCYPGQELVERMDARQAAARRHLVVVDVPVEATVGDTVGRHASEHGPVLLTSVSGTRALGYAGRAPSAGSSSAATSGSDSAASSGR